MLQLFKYNITGSIKVKTSIFQTILVLEIIVSCIYTYNTNHFVVRAGNVRNKCVIRFYENESNARHLSFDTIHSIETQACDYLNSL